MNRSGQALLVYVEDTKSGLKGPKVPLLGRATYCNNQSNIAKLFVIKTHSTRQQKSNWTYCRLVLTDLFVCLGLIHCSYKVPAPKGLLAVPFTALISFSTSSLLLENLCRELGKKKNLSVVNKRKVNIDCAYY